MIAGTSAENRYKYLFYLDVISLSLRSCLVCVFYTVKLAAQKPIQVSSSFVEPGALSICYSMGLSPLGF